jgi:anti-anti-sigma factor
VLSPMSSPFRVETRPDRDRVIVAAIGELVFATVPIVREAIAQLREVGWPQIVLDLRAVAFMDSSATHLIQRILDAADEERFAFAIIDGPASVMRVLDLTGLSRRLSHAVDPRPGGSSSTRSRGWQAVA